VKVFCLYSVIGLATIVGQTTLLRIPVFQGVFYDLLIPLVVFMRLHLTLTEASLLTLILGFVMDLFSGGVFGLYMTVYLWIFLLVQGVSDYFNVQGTACRSALIAFCVLGQNLIFLISTAHPWKGWHWLSAQIWPALGQIMLAAVTGPAVLSLLETMHRSLEAPEAISRRGKGSMLGNDE
jgi:cell shape-determining protein MreD